MAKPPDLPNWATDANYPVDAAPETGSLTKVEPTSGKQALGWRPKEKPKSQSLNWWQNLVYLWVVWIDTVLAIGSKTRDVSAGDGFAVSGTFTIGGTGVVLCTVGGTWVVNIPLHVGDTLESVSYNVKGDGSLPDITLIDVTVTTRVNTTTSLGSGGITNVGASWDQSSFDGVDLAFAEHTLAAGEVFHIAFVSAQAGISIGNVEYTYRQANGLV